MKLSPAADSDLYRQVLQVSPDPVVVIDPEGIILDANTQLAQCLAIPSHSLVGKSIRDFLQPAVFNTLLDGGVAPGEIQLKTAGAVWKTMGIKQRKLIDSGDAVVATVLFFSDLTRQLALEFYVRENEARFRAIFDHAPMGLIQLDEEGQFITANPSFQRILGFPEEELKRRNFREMVHPMDRERIDNGRIRLITGPSQFTWVQISRAVFSGNEGRHEIIVVENVQNQVESEEKLEHQSQLLLINAKMASLGQMAAGVAHEVNNPLAVLKTRVHVLEQSCSDTKAKEHLTVIDRNISRIEKIVQGLKTYSRSSKSDPFNQIQMSELIEDVMSLCLGMQKTSHVQLSAQPIQPDFLIACRPAELSQVLCNLVLNACDAVENLSEKWVQLQVHDKGHAFEVRVIDSGQGIRPEIRQKLFDPFFTTKEVGKGTGLGLSIALGIVERHGGRLWLDTTSPNTCFVVHLPKEQSGTKVA